MRGRAAEIDDASTFDWEVVWEALKTEPPAEDASTITQELGLGEEREISQTTTEMAATELAGTRHGVWQVDDVDDLGAAEAGDLHGSHAVRRGQQWPHALPRERLGRGQPLEQQGTSHGPGLLVR